MTRVLVAAVLLAMGAGSPNPGAEDKYLETIKVADDIYVFKPKIDWTHGNGVAIIAPEGVFFIDTYRQFNYAEEAIRRLRRVTKLPVRYVLNTHWHFDHAMGNDVFKHAFPQSQIIVDDSTAAYMEQRLKPKLQVEGAGIDGTIAQLDSEITKGQLASGLPVTGSMIPFWSLMLREAREYKAVYRPQQYFGADITFSDTLTMRWGSQTLRLIHMGENGHSPGDVVVWIPEKRLLVAGDVVVAPTPYATYFNVPGMIKAIRAVIAMNPAIVIPGHGAVEYDLSYMRLLERAFSEYRHAAETALAANVPLRQARDSIVFPEIDRAFTGDDQMKKYAYRAFFARNLIRYTYQPTPPPPPPVAKP